MPLPEYADRCAKFKMRNLKIKLTLVLLLINTGIYACSCIGQRIVKEEIKYSDAILVGTVISKELVTLTDSTAIKMYNSESTITEGFHFETTIAKYKLLVKSKYKGKITADIVEIYTGLGGGDCGVRFELGKEYIVYGKKETYFGQKNNNWQFPRGKNIFWTDICSRTTLANKEEIKAVEKYRKKK